MAETMLDEAYYKLLHDLQAVDFVLVELNLYLDTHPGDEAAIAQFNQYAELRKRIAAQYEAAYGPLMNFGHSMSKTPWQWKEAPWPWQV
ncbi:spore coat protein CotJB [Paenibacillus sp. MY03]|jgi:spore coat protein JB|uniref:Spore coat protein CotJB n=1 Tax=Paenibacillus agaridevorans TaxID=171404 RepID=A0A2R5ESX3_9BACL|nr:MULTISPECIES: spore coat protein CotJB [Paenibacillus]OUS76992.1 spore coat protein CotJB [Paenibacillus sp. MY03]GBG06501.1 spore coat protein CotJB [Paenibacillus agaridevorans]